MTKRPHSLVKYLLLLPALSMGVFTSCSEDDDTTDDSGNWIDRSVFDGIPRSGASYFSINNTGYAGLGYDGSDYLNDFWAYDMEGDYWVQKADFPGNARNAAVAFTVNEQGYVGSGYDGVNNLGDFYHYNPGTNTWEAIAEFPENPRRSAIAFGGNQYGYFGTGFDGANDRKDFWRYDPSTDSWTQLVGFGGNKRRAATSFRINDMVYVGTGSSNGSNLTDFWQFDLTTEKWTKMLDLDEEDEYSIARSNAVGFTLNGYGYIACGNISGSTATVWQYTPELDTWEEKTGFEGTSRQDPVAFSNGLRAYVGMGRSGSLYLDDMDEFFPFEEYEEED